MRQGWFTYRSINQQALNKGQHSVDEFEAIDLRSFLLITCAASRIVLHQLGNREWCLRTIQDGGAWFIWSMADARAFLQGIEDQGRTMDEKRPSTWAGENRERVSV